MREATATIKEAKTTSRGAHQHHPAGIPGQVGYHGTVNQAVQAAEQAGRRACLAEARRIVDPAARQQIAALRPAAK